MKHLRTYLAIGPVAFATTCMADTAAISSRILPPPQSVHVERGSFTLTEKTSLVLGSGSEVVGRYFAERLRHGTGWPVPVLTNAPGTICFEAVAQPGRSPEAYSLNIGSAGVVVRAASATGIARGAETLADTIGAYTLRLYATPLNGDCAALIQHLAALAPDGYSKQCAPGTGANRSKQTPAR